MRTILALGLLACVAGCTSNGGSTGTGSGTTGGSSTTGSTTGGANIYDAGPIGLTNCVPPPMADAGLVEALVAANNQFALNLFGKLTEGIDGNVFIAPYSVSTAFALLDPGATGENATEITATLGFPTDGVTLGPVVGALDCELTADGLGGDGGLLALANALFLDTSFTPKPAFVAEAVADFSAHVQSLDLQGQPVSSAAAIDSWVSHQTQYLIPQLIQPTQLDPTTDMVLVSTLLFEGRWPQPFPSATDGTFLANGTDSITVEVMADPQFYAGYSEQADFKVLEMFTQGSQIAVDLLLPNDPTSLGSYEVPQVLANLSADFTAATPQIVDVILPKLHLDTSQELSSVLKAMGMESPFTLSGDFANLTDGSVGISFVQHEAVLDFDEVGVHAAGATAIGVHGSSGTTTSGQPPPTFHADHPFLIVIRDVANGSFLFMGQVMDPSQN